MTLEGLEGGRYRARESLKTKSLLFVGQPRKGNRYLMVKTNAAMYLRKSTEDDGKSVG